LTAVSLDGTPVPYTVATVKGIENAFFAAASGRYSAVYDG
jgi:hypothetical protein